MPVDATMNLKQRKINLHKKLTQVYSHYSCENPSLKELLKWAKDLFRWG